MQKFMPIAVARLFRGGGFRHRWQDLGGVRGHYMKLASALQKVPASEEAGYSNCAPQGGKTSAS